MHPNELEPYAAPSQGRASGSGILVGTGGTILTNCHVVRDAYSLQIRLSRFGDHTFAASTIYISTERDLALLQVHEPDRLCEMLGVAELPVVEFADSSMIRRGEHVLAVGYPLGMRQQVTTQGVINAKQWAAQRGGVYLQIQAPINHGSSGGALFVATHVPIDSDSDEEEEEEYAQKSDSWRLHLVGVNSAGIDSANLIGFAIESDEVRAFLADVTKSGGADKIIRSSNKLGLLYNNLVLAHSTKLGLDDATTGVVVHGLDPDSPLHNCVVLGANQQSLCYDMSSSPLQHGDIVTHLSVAPTHSVAAPQRIPEKWKTYNIDSRGQVSITNNYSVLPLEVATCNMSRGDYVKLRVLRPHDNNATHHVVCRMHPRPPTYPRQWLPAHEMEPDCHSYTVLGGMVLRPLSQNIIDYMVRVNPGAAAKLSSFRNESQHHHGFLVVTHIFMGSEFAEQLVATPGSGINTVNGHSVRCLQSLFSAIQHTQTNMPVSVGFADGRVSYINQDKLISDTRHLQNLFHFQNTPAVDILEQRMLARDDPHALGQAHIDLTNRVQNLRVVRQPSGTVSLES